MQDFATIQSMNEDEDLDEGGEDGKDEDDGVNACNMLQC